MKRTTLFLLALIMLALPAAAQTLADRARELRKEKRTPSANEKVFTNESLSLRPAPAITTETKPDAKDAAKKDAEEGDEEKQPTPDEVKAKLAGEYREKIDKAKAEIATLQRELDIAERENKLRVAQFYADAGNRLRDEKKFVEDQNKTLADIADKRKRLADTTTALEQARSEARRAGIAPGLIP
jgi:hypothetical protein